MPSWLLLAGVCLTPSVEQRWEPLRIEARVAPVRPSVGEPIMLELEIEGPASLPARPLSPRDWGPLSLRSREALPVERLGAGGVRRRWRWQLQAWRLGELQLPPIELRRGEARLSLPPLSIQVSSVLGEGESELRPLRAPRALPDPPRSRPWGWLLAGLVLAGAVLWRRGR